MRVEFLGLRGQIQAFVVQHFELDDKRWRPHIRYDTSHGRPHRDMIDRRGRQMDKKWLPVDWTLNQALTFAESDLKENWRMYRDRYWGR